MPDPIKHHSWSPYVSMNDNPIALVDPMGLEPDDCGPEAPPPSTGSTPPGVNDPVLDPTPPNGSGNGAANTGGNNNGQSDNDYVFDSNPKTQFSQETVSGTADDAQAAFRKRAHEIMDRAGPYGKVTVTENLDSKGSFNSGTIEWDNPIETGYELFTTTISEIQNNPGSLIALPKVGSQINDDFQTRKLSYYEPTMGEYNQVKGLSRGNIKQADYAVMRNLRLKYTRSKLSPLGQAFSNAEKSTGEAAKVLDEIKAGKRDVGAPRGGLLKTGMTLSNYQTFRVLGWVGVLWQVNESVNTIVDSKGDVGVIVKEGSGWAGAYMGAALGAEAGFIAGSFLAPICPVCPAIGAIVGGVYGGMAGAKIFRGEH